jgi:hypothetical protein
MKLVSSGHRPTAESQKENLPNFFPLNKIFRVLLNFQNCRWEVDKNIFLFVDSSLLLHISGIFKYHIACTVFFLNLFPPIFARIYTFIICMTVYFDWEGGTASPPRPYGYNQPLLRIGYILTIVLKIF